MSDKKIAAVLAEFKGPKELLHAAERLKEAGYKNYDCHSPFPIHGMDKAMGEKRSNLGWIVGTVAFIAVTLGFLLEAWTSVYAYPLVIAGKPLLSYQAYGPVAFAVMVLSSAGAALLGMLALNKLPRYNHPLFNSENFKKVTDNGFFVSIEMDDNNIDITAIEELLSGIGGKNIEKLNDE